MGQSEPSRWRGVFADFSPRRLPGTIGTGLVLAMVNVLLAIALISLVFTGPLHESLPIGIGVGLVGSAVVALVVGVGSTFPGMYAGIQDASTAIIGLSAAAVVGAAVAPNGLDTVLVMMAVTSLATGLTFLAMGYFRLGEIARFVPFPVIGGLLAGTGYLIVAGAMAVLGVEGLANLNAPEASGLAWPGFLLAALLFVASTRRWSSWVYLGILAGGVASFHVVTLLVGTDRELSLARGWLLGPMPEGGLWPGLVVESLSGADWAAIAAEGASLASILVIVPISVLLYLSAIEIETKKDVDIGVELRSTGWANVASSVVGAPPGYLYLADTVMTYRLVGPRRGSVIAASLVIISVVAAGGAFLELIPQFVIGGILLFFGLEFLAEWLWSARRRMSWLDYLLMCGIVVIIATVGFLEGVATGLVAAIVLFVVRYSRIDVVKHSLTGREHQSNIERPAQHAKLLREVGGAVLVLELQGFMFFGTAGRVIGRLRSQLESEDLGYVICDFRLVSGVDSSAVAVLERVGLLAREHGLVVILTGLGPTLRNQLSELLVEYGDVVREEPDLDRGIAWSEERLLEDAAASVGGLRALPEGLEAALSPYLVERRIRAGEEMMIEGDPAPGIFLMRQGRATVLLRRDDGSQVRLRTLLEGTVLGEISLYRDEPVSATVVAETDCDVLHLTPQNFDELRRTDPATAADFHAFVARTLAARLSYANRTIRALRS